MNYEYLTEEEIKEIEKEYGDINNYIKDEVYDNKKETTNFMDKAKYLFFLYLLKGKSKKEFKSKIDEEYEKFKKDIDKNKVKGYKIVSDLTKYQNEGTYTRTSEKFVKMNLNGLLSRYGIELTSTKKEDDKYIRVLEKYYSSTEKTLNKPWVNANEYLSKKVSEFDKVEKTVAYRSKATGNIRAYFDIASYDSMVYNVNLTNTGWKESIKYCIEEDNDIVYIEPHGYSCDLCRPLQGKFYTLSSKPKVYNDMIVQPLETAIKQGLRHPNCTHIPQPANEFQNVSNKYSGDLWSEKYNAKQKKQALELKKKRLLNDNKVYKELGNEEMIDKNKQKINAINRKIRDVKNSIQGIKTNEYEEYKERQKALKEIAKQKEKEKLAKERAIKKELQRQSSQTHKEMQELFKIRENRPKYIEQLENKQQELKEVRKIISKNQKDMKYWEAKQRELSLKVDIKNLKELIKK